MPEGTIDPTLRTALDALRAGFQPTFLRPASKMPALGGWQNAKHESARDLREAFAEASEGYPDKRLNLGLVLGKPSRGLVDIDIDHHKALRVASDVLPYTPMRSGRAGRPSSHHWYVVEGFDPGVKRLTLPNGHSIIEWRGTGGQTVVPPSIHPGGEPYTWFGNAWGGDDGPTVLNEEEGKSLYAAVHMVALAVTLADNWPSKGGRHGAYLALVGGLLRSADDEGRPALHPFWNRNIEGLIRVMVALTNDADGASSRVAESVPSTRKKIVAGTPAQGWPTLAEILGEKHFVKVRELVETLEDLAGIPRRRPVDGSEAVTPSTTTLKASSGLLGELGADMIPEERDVLLATTPDEERDPLLERINEWDRVDLGPYLRTGYRPPAPAFLFREDGRGMIYPKRVNMLYGEGGSGKTMIAFDIARQALEQGGKVLVIDLEDEPANVIRRLQELGVPDSTIDSDVFTYLHPERSPLSVMEVDRWGEAKASKIGSESSEAFAHVLERYNPDLIIVDGTTTLYRIHGLDTNTVQGADLVGGWLRDLTNSYTRTVLMIDHTPKNASPTSGPIGSQHKIAMVQGIALRVNSITKPRRGATATATLVIGKDRPGEVMQYSSHSSPPVAAEVTFDSDDEGNLKITYEAPHKDSSPSVEVQNDGKTGGRPPKVNAANRRKVLDAMRSHGGWLTTTEAFLAAGLTEEDIGKVTRRKLLAALVEAGEIMTEGTGKGKKWKFYASDDA